MLGGTEDGSEVIPDPLMPTDIVVDLENGNALITARFSVSASKSGKDKQQSSWSFKAKKEFDGLLQQALAEEAKAIEQDHTDTPFAKAMERGDQDGGGDGDGSGDGGLPRRFGAASKAFNMSKRVFKPLDDLSFGFSSRAHSLGQTKKEVEENKDSNQKGKKKKMVKKKVIKKKVMRRQGRGRRPEKGSLEETFEHFVKAARFVRFGDGVKVLHRKFRAQREITLIARGMKLTRLCSHAPVALLLPARVGQRASSYDSLGSSCRRGMETRLNKPGRAVVAATLS